MTERNKNKKGLHYEQKDVLNLEYKKEIFDLIIDKATMDTVLCTDNALLNITKMTKEISRSLKTGGVYLVLSYGRPDERLIHLKRDHLAFDIKICKVVKSEKNGKINYDMSIQEEDEEINGENKEEKKVHYAYVCKKLPEANDKLENFRQVYNEMKEYLAKCEKENSSDSEKKEEKKENISKENKEIKKEKKHEISNENNNEIKEKEDVMDIEEETKEESREETLKEIREHRKEETQAETEVFTFLDEDDPEEPVLRLPGEDT